MIKKISAIILALVLCLSVVVVPASAAVELGDAQIALSLEWDKEYYKGGDTAVLSVYMDAADDLELYTGSILFAFNSATISSDDNAIATVKSNSTTSDWFSAYYFEASSKLAWLTNTKQIGYVTDDSTADEIATYDTYLKFTMGKNPNGSHDNAGSNTNGFYGSDFVDGEPIITLSFVVNPDAADGTKVSAGIMSGSLTTTSGNPHTHFKYYTDPGVAGTANVDATTIDVTQTAIASTIGEAETTIISSFKHQVRVNKDNADNRDIRNLAEIDGATLDQYIGDVTGDDAKEAKLKAVITDVGFIMQRSTSGTKFDRADAIEWHKTGASPAGATYADVKASTISSKNMGQTAGNYLVSCIVMNQTQAQLNESLVTLGYIVLDTDGNGEGDAYYYYSDVVVKNFADSYNKG